MKYGALISLGLMLSTPAFAQQAAVPPTTVAAQPDAARMEIARRVVTRMIPTGTYRKVMETSLTTVTNSMLASMSKLSLRDLAASGGAPADRVDKMTDASLGEAMTILDPAFSERASISTNVMLGEMVSLVEGMEPDLREGMAEAMASRFSTEQLIDIDRFFQTPSGNAFASQYVLLGSDPAMLSRMNAMMPKVMNQMPNMMKKMAAATAHLPKPKRYEELTPAARRRFDALIGVNPAPKRRKR